MTLGSWRPAATGKRGSNFTDVTRDRVSCFGLLHRSIYFPRWPECVRPAPSLLKVSAESRRKERKWPRLFSFWPPERKSNGDHLFNGCFHEESSGRRCCVSGRTCFDPAKNLVNFVRGIGHKELHVLTGVLTRQPAPCFGDSTTANIIIMSRVIKVLPRALQWKVRCPPLARRCFKRSRMPQDRAMNEP